MGLPAFQIEFSTLVSADEYLRLDAGAEGKLEFTNGLVWAMAGADPSHNDINYNLNQAIGAGLRVRSCKASMSDQRVQTKSRGGYLYPDTVVTCGPRTFSEGHKPSSLTNPILIVEVTSPSTTNRDHTEKFMLYRQIPSLRQYLMLSSVEFHAELYTLDELGRWVLTETRDLHATLDLNSIACQVPLAEVYADVELSAGTTPIV